AELDGHAEPPELRILVGRECDRVRDAEPRVAHHAREHDGNDDVENRADDEAREDADRHVPRRIARLLRSGRDGIEADIREEDHPGTGDDAAPTVFAEYTGIRRDE